MCCIKSGLRVALPKSNANSRAINARADELAFNVANNVRTPVLSLRTCNTACWCCQCCCHCRRAIRPVRASHTCCPRLSPAGVSRKSWSSCEILIAKNSTNLPSICKVAPIPNGLASHVIVILCPCLRYAARVNSLVIPAFSPARNVRSH